MKRIVIILLSVSFAVTMSCATAGKSFNMEEAKRNIRMGETTKEQVLVMCGEPLSKGSDLSNEKEIWHYARVEKNITSFGVFTHMVGVGDEWKSNASTMDVSFKNGVVVDLKCESSGIKTFNLK
jgi:hypothetical protein